MHVLAHMAAVHLLAVMTTARPLDLDSLWLRQPQDLEAIPENLATLLGGQPATPAQLRAASSTSAEASGGKEKEGGDTKIIKIEPLDAALSAMIQADLTGHNVTGKDVG